MIGASAEIVLADAYLKGVTGFDAEGAYQILRAAAMDPTAPPGGRGGRDQVVPYMTLRLRALGRRATARCRSPPSTRTTTSRSARSPARSATPTDAAALATRAARLPQALRSRDGLPLVEGRRRELGHLARRIPPCSRDDFARGQRVAERCGWSPSTGRARAPSAGRETLDRDARGDVRADARRTTSRSTGRTSSKRAASAPYYWARQRARHPRRLPLRRRSAGPTSRRSGSRWIRASWFTAGADGLPGNDDGGTMSAWLRVERARDLSARGERPVRDRRAALPARGDRGPGRHVHHRRAGGLGHEPLRAVGDAERRAARHAGPPPRRPEGGRPARRS